MGKEAFRKQCKQILNSKMSNEEKDKNILLLIKNYENDPFILNAPYPNYDAQNNATLVLALVDHEIKNSALSLIKNKNVNINGYLSNMNLLMFAMVRDIDFVKALLEREDLDPSYQINGVGALNFAISHSSLEVVKMLMNSKLNFKLNLNIPNEPILLEALNNNNMLLNHLVFNGLNVQYFKNGYDLSAMLLDTLQLPIAELFKKNKRGMNFLTRLFENIFDVPTEEYQSYQLKVIKKVFEVYHFHLNCHDIEINLKNANTYEKPTCSNFVLSYIKSLEEKKYLENNTNTQDKQIQKKLKKL